MADDGKSIYLTYLNIRHSISILLFKLILVDFLAAGLLVAFYFTIVRGEEIANIALTNTNLFLIVFGILGAIKVATTSYVVLQWLNEYYEITPEAIVHKSGIIFKKEEKYSLSNVRAMSISQNFLGELLNYGTITVYDTYMREYLAFYLIHNPVRYIHVLQALKPNIEIKKEETILPLVRPHEI